MVDQPIQVPRNVQAGVYRHWKGPLYLVLGLAHDANADDLYTGASGVFMEPEPLGERQVVVYIGLQLDAAHEGPRLAVRTLEDFFALVCAGCGTELALPLTTNHHCLAGMYWPVERFSYLGPTYVKGMAR